MFIQTKRLNLRPVEKTDAEMLRDSRNCASSLTYLNSFIPQTIDSEEKWLERVMSADSHIIFVAETKGDNSEVVGIFGIHDINHMDGTCVTGANIWKEKFQSKGYGFEAKMHVLHYIFNYLNIRKVCSAALSSNPRSIAYQKKTGAVEEGVLKCQHFQAGVYVDRILLSIFRQDFKKKWKEFQKGSED